MYVYMFCPPYLTRRTVVFAHSFEQGPLKISYSPVAAMVHFLRTFYTIYSWSAVKVAACLTQALCRNVWLYFVNKRSPTLSHTTSSFSFPSWRKSCTVIFRDILRCIFSLLWIQNKFLKLHRENIPGVCPCGVSVLSYAKVHSQQQLAYAAYPFHHLRRSISLHLQTRQYSLRSELPVASFALYTSTTLGLLVTVLCWIWTVNGKLQGRPSSSFVLPSRNLFLDTTLQLSHHQL